MRIDTSFVAHVANTAQTTEGLHVCPECEWRGVGVFDEAAIDDYDERLDFGTRELAEELRTFERANMRAFLECFTAALSADLIGPEDF